MVLITDNNDTRSHFVFTTLDTRRSESFKVTKCYNCFGGLILFKRKAEFTKEHLISFDWFKKRTMDTLKNYAMIGWHILPDVQNMSSISNKIIVALKSILEFYEPITFCRCGGRIHEKEDVVLFEKMVDLIDQKVIAKIPNAHVTGILPEKNTCCTTITYRKNGKFYFQYWTYREVSS